MEEKERIEKIMETENMNATQFALEIGIQSSTLSHILNGRNKPSLDVIKRILNRFRTISSDWLMLGVGSMYRSNSQAQQSFPFDIKPQSPVVTSDITSVRQEDSQSLMGNESKEKQVVTGTQQPKTNAPAKSITRIVVFYSDNSFDELIRQ